MGTDQGFTLGYRPSLDAVRGVAVLLVVASHTKILQAAGFPVQLGETGVTIFFALSGFLITSLLLEERQRSGTVALGRFLGRRALRLFPALVVFLVVVTTVTWWVGYAHPFRDAGWTSTYVANWFQTTGQKMFFTGHVWSLAIEEQFYLGWPLVVAALPVRRSRHVAVVGTAASVGLAFLLWDGPSSIPRVYFGTDTRVGAILAGCALAYWVGRGGRLHGATAGWALLAVSATGVLPLPVRLLLSTAGSVLVIGSVLEGRGAPVLVWLGKRSYGLYLWHFPVFRFGEMWVPNVLARASIAIPLSLLLTELSWRHIEQPALRLKDRMARQPGPEARGVVAVRR